MVDLQTRHTPPDDESNRIHALVERLEMVLSDSRRTRAGYDDALKGYESHQAVTINGAAVPITPRPRSQG